MHWWFNSFPPFVLLVSSRERFKIAGRITRTSPAIGWRIILCSDNVNSGAKVWLHTSHFTFRVEFLSFQSAQLIISLNTFVRSFSRFFVLFVFFVLKLENSWAGENRYPKVAIEALCVFYDRNNEDQQYPLFTHFKLSRTNESRTISTKLSLQLGAHAWKLR
jgi:hypothetical protein